MVMHDAIDETQVGQIPTGEAFRQRFGNPYAVIHRVDVHQSLLEGAQESGRVEFHTRARVENIEQAADREPIDNWTFGRATLLGEDVYKRQGPRHHGRRPVVQRGRADAAAGSGA